MRRFSRTRVLGGLVAVLWVIVCVALWKNQRIAPRATLSGTKNRRQVQLVCFSPDSRTLALAHAGKKSLQLWDVTTGWERFSIPVEGEVSFSPDGALLAVQGKDTLTLWDVFTGRQHGEIPGRISNHSFSPDGKRLAGWGSPEGEQLKLWEV